MKPHNTLTLGLLLFWLYLLCGAITYVHYLICLYRKER